MSIRRLIGRNAQERAGSVTFNSPATWISPNRVVQVTVDGRGGTGQPGNNGGGGNAGSVSYTHLTLPTIYSV